MNLETKVSGRVVRKVCIKRPPELSSTPFLSIIIPALNEEENIARTLASIRNTPDAEIIVVDGNSADRTVDVARSYGVKALTANPGRAGQMNAGAAAAKGRALLFLHADTLLPDAFDEIIRRIIAQPGVSAGAFRLKIDAPSRGLRFIEWAANLRSKYLKMPYGDQAIFLRADLFNDLGGYAKVPIMEDVELIRRLRLRGRIAISNAPVFTSARRWEKLGLTRTTLINYGMIIAYHLGVSTTRLAQWYYGHRRQL